MCLKRWCNVFRNLAKYAPTELEKIVDHHAPSTYQENESSVVFTLLPSTTGVKTAHIKHDYFEIWRNVLEGLVAEFVDLLKEESEIQERRTELKEDLIRFLELR